MTTAYLTQIGKFRGVDNNGAALAGGLVYTYSAGTTTPIATYTDSTAGTPNANPVVLNARGEADIWLKPNVGYKFKLTDRYGALIWTEDNVYLSQLLTVYGGVDSGAVNSYVINFAGNFTSLTDGIYIVWFPANTNTAPSQINVNGLGNVAIVNPDGSGLSPSEIIVNQPTTILYKAGQWVLVSSGLSATYQSGSFTATLTGCTVAVTGTVYWVRIGNQVTLNLPFTLTGTSNTTLASITGLPAAVLPITYGYSALLQVWDNGVLAVGYASITAASQITLFKIGGAGLSGFTNVGTKGVGAFTMTYFTQ